MTIMIVTSLLGRGAVFRHRRRVMAHRPMLKEGVFMQCSGQVASSIPAIPADILAGKPNPGKWGLPTANFDTRHGHCDLEQSFQPQTIVSIPNVE